jgi:non-specific serine/threonine protein kinase
MKNHQLIYQLVFHEDLKKYLPVAYVALFKNKIPHEIIKLANENNLKSLNFELLGNELKVWQISQTLETSKLLNKYGSKQKKIKTIAEAYQHPDIKKAIDFYINFQLTHFYDLIFKYKTYLFIDVERGQPLNKYLLEISHDILYPDLNFEQKEEHIIYELKLKNKKTFITPNQHKISILNNSPALIILKNKIYQLEHLNANKLIPFLNKVQVIIPNRSKVEYFEKIIGPILKKIDVNAKGFEVKIKNQLHYATIKPVNQMLNNQVFLDLIFSYDDGISFSNISHNKNRVTIINNDEDFYVIKIERQFIKEKEIKIQLENLGFFESEHGLFSFKNDKNGVYDNLQKILELKTELEKINIKLDNQFGTKKLYDKSFEIIENIEKKKDWFDVKIVIVCQGFNIAFPELLPYLKSNERFFPITNELYFLIPLEWFSKYENVIKLGKPDGEIIKFLANQEAVIAQAFQHNQKTQTLFYSELKSLNADLRPFQIEGVNFLLKHYESDTGCVLADDMGLGKTLQTLAYLNLLFHKFPENFEIPTSQILDLFTSFESKKILRALIVVPSSLVFNWQTEIKKFTPHFSSFNYIGASRKSMLDKLSNVDIVITSYPILTKDSEILKDLNFHFLIIDEGQYIKNKESKIFKAINSLNIKHKIALSGTPIENSLSDLWSQMQFTNPNILGNYQSFKENYKWPIEKNNDESLKESLKSTVKDYILRRLKIHVLKELPDIIEQTVITEMSPKQAKIYEEEKSKVRNIILNGLSEDNTINQINILNALIKLRQIANHPKLLNIDETSGKFELITQYLEDIHQNNKKVLIFSSFVKHLKIYEQWCDVNNFEYATLTGQLSNIQRQNEINKFQNIEDCKFFFISLKAGGTGLNLTQAHYVIMLDPWWNPFAEQQAIARAHRLGQQNKVHVYKFISKETIEEKILNLQQDKKALSDDILETNHVTTVVKNVSDYL